MTIVRGIVCSCAVLLMSSNRAGVVAQTLPQADSGNRTQAPSACEVLNNYKAGPVPDGHAPVEARADERRVSIACALLYRRQQQYERALALLLEENRRIPNDPQLLLDTALLEDEMHLYRDADQTVSAALVLAPDDPTTLYAQARIKMDLQQIAPAEAAMKAYLKLRPNDASAYYGLGRMYHAELRNEEAAAAFSRSLLFAPHQAESNYQMGELALEGGREDEASRFYEAALAVDPQHAGALTGEAILAFRRKNYAHAERLLRAAEASAPQFHMAHYYRGLVLARLGKKQESDAELKLSAKLAEVTKGDKGLQLIEHP